jgi:Xaa-Pro dipeptidase
VIESGDVIACDTDLIGPHGYAADVSRSWIAGDKRPTDEQRRLYAAAYQQVHADIELFRPGASVLEIADRAHVLPTRYVERQNPCVAHGIGLCNEYPLVLHKRWIESDGHDGVVEEGMVFCVESFVGASVGGEAVKLEEQILVTAHGPEKLPPYPYEEQLL